MSQTHQLIAVIDDEEPVRRAISRLLRSAGLEARTFASGPEFLHALRDGPPACVLLDLHMEPMSGLHLLAELAVACPRVPVIVITGHDTPENRTCVMDAGAHAFFSKPVDGQALLDAVAEAIGGIPMARERSQAGGDRIASR